MLPLACICCFLISDYQESIFIFYDVSQLWTINHVSQLSMCSQLNVFNWLENNKRWEKFPRIQWTPNKRIERNGCMMKIVDNDFFAVFCSTLICSFWAIINRSQMVDLIPVHSRLSKWPVQFNYFRSKKSPSKTKLRIKKILLEKRSNFCS